MENCVDRVIQWCRIAAYINFYPIFWCWNVLLYTAEGHSNEGPAGYESPPYVSLGACATPARQERHVCVIGPARDGAESEVSVPRARTPRHVYIWLALLGLDLVLPASCQDAGGAAAAAGEALSRGQWPLHHRHSSHICRQPPQGEHLTCVCGSEERAQLQSCSFCRHVNITQSSRYFDQMIVLCWCFSLGPLLLFFSCHLPLSSCLCSGFCSCCWALGVWSWVVFIMCADRTLPLFWILYVAHVPPTSITLRSVTRTVDGAQAVCFDVCICVLNFYSAWACCAETLCESCSAASPFSRALSL